MKNGIVWASFFVSILLLGIGAAKSYFETQRLIIDQRWVSHTNSVIAAIDDLQASSRQATSIIATCIPNETQDPNCAESFKQAAYALPTKLESLQALTSDNSA